MWCVIVCDLDTSGMRRPWPTGGSRTKNKQTNKILQRTPSSVYELNTNRYRSVEQNHDFHSRMTTGCGLKKNHQATITKTLK
jgi:hypothetical protein